ncbi:molecular chaperone HtpG [Porphyromonas crevioricanis]|uniref:Chaperone protein HtpG n=1 Tax=Porphyromonas crevioricanis TaxID=393921 RepID=A0AB34PF08_9PORP|nr:molecular chaperone HtpG [Porphyromonas crevioricanis]KGN94244.1 molecular chaperone Hsp90 [Porphyromonas crevioricanis]
MNKKGRIGVTSDNIFPVIKKFLYSDHDIFLRELVSNAVDATNKLRTLASKGEAKGELGELSVRIQIDPEAKTLTVSDRGIGMTAEELDRYINEIAFSGAEEFLEKYKDDKANIIGHFGLGFYSAFMVAKKVEVFTKSHQTEAPAVYWSCTGDPDYEMTVGDKQDRGTDIVLHIDEENKEFLQPERISELLKKYCRFLNVPIIFGKEQEWKDGKYQDTERDNQINDTTPAWTRQPAELKDEDYKTFYHDLYPMGDDPLFWIHLNVDYPFNLTGILYFPRVTNQIELQRNKIQLYCNQVFVTDEVEGIVPDYLTLLHGVIDSPDIPLNVSRSYLQSDARVKKISSHITKKVADRLEELFKKDRQTYEEKWDSLKIFIAYGMLTDEKFYDRALKFYLFTDTEGKHYTYEEYTELVRGEQTDKDERLVMLYTTSKDEQYVHVKRATDKGYSVLVMDGQLDVHTMSRLEQKHEKTAFVRVDSATSDKLINKEEKAGVSLGQEDSDILREVFGACLPTVDKKSFHIQLASMGATADAVTITQDEFMRRMQEMAKLQPGMNFYGQLPDSYNIVLNTDHELIVRILNDTKMQTDKELTTVRQQLNKQKEEVAKLSAEQQGKKDEEIPSAEKEALEKARKEEEKIKAEISEKLSQYGKSNELIGQLLDLALLSGGLLTGEALANFVSRSQRLL